MKRRAPPSRAVGVDKRADFGLDAGLRKRGDDEFTLPRAVAGGRPVLHGATAADGKVRTYRRNALVTWGDDLEQLPPVGMAGRWFGADGFTGQRVAHIDRPAGGVGNAVAEMAEPVDGEVFAHVAGAGTTSGKPGRFSRISMRQINSAP